MVLADFEREDDGNLSFHGKRNGFQTIQRKATSARSNYDVIHSCGDNFFSEGVWGNAFEGSKAVSPKKGFRKGGTKW